MGWACGGWEKAWEEKAVCGPRYDVRWEPWGWHGGGVCVWPGGRPGFFPSLSVYLSRSLASVFLLSPSVSSSRPAGGNGGVFLFSMFLAVEREVFVFSSSWRILSSGRLAPPSQIFMYFSLFRRPRGMGYPHYSDNGPDTAGAACAPGGYIDDITGGALARTRRQSI